MLSKWRPSCTHLQKYMFEIFVRQSMSHRFLIVGRPALSSAKQPLISYNKLPVFRRLHNPAPRDFHPQARYRPVSLRTRCLPAVYSRRQSIRFCSYKNIMCRAKDDLAAASVDVSKGREVLPANVKPVHYSLTLEPDFEKFTYEGEVVIEYVKPTIQHIMGTKSLLIHLQQQALTDGCVVSMSKKLRLL